MELRNSGILAEVGLNIQSLNIGCKLLLHSDSAS